MLLHRVLTALVLLPLLLALVWWAPTPWVYGLFSVAAALAALEWAALTAWGRGQPGRGRAYALVLLLLFMMAAWAPGRALWLPLLLGLVALHWLWALYALAGYPERLRPVTTSLWSAPQGLVLLLATVLACAELHALSQGPLKLLFALFLVFAADVGAYLAGRNLGRRKLAPRVSPGKTVEGAVGGVLLCVVWALVAGLWLFEVQGLQALWFVLLCLVVAVFSVVGDLLESAYKRLAEVKDSGTLLPGHGGVLDRIDSLLAALPLFVLGLMALGLA